MQLRELTAHLERIDRSLRRASRRKGDRHEHPAEVAGYGSQRFVINGVPPMEDVEDHVRHALIDLWSLRDYVLHVLKTQGKDTGAVWARIKTRRYLALSADLANLAKHGLLTKKPHGLCVPTFGNSKYTMTLRRDPQTGRLIGSGIKQLVTRIGEVEVDVMNHDDPRWFSYELPILDPDGDQFDEACNVLVRGFEEWSQLLTDLGIPWPDAGWRELQARLRVE